MMNATEKAELFKRLNTAFPSDTIMLLEKFILETSGSGEPVEKDYKELVGYLTQSGEDAPILRIIKNDFNETPIWGRLQIGIYSMSFPTIKFDINKTIFNNVTSFFTTGISQGFLKSLIFSIDDSDEDSLYFRNQPESIANSSPEDNITIPYPFILRIYN
jgi:hypothetical protein